jgi:hypothetical protein
MEHGLVMEAVEFMELSKASTTKDTYRSAVEKWKKFVFLFRSPQWPIVWHAPTRWDMVLYLTWIAPFLKLASIHVYLYAMRDMVMRQGLPNPLECHFLELTWRGIKKAKREKGQKRWALTVPRLRRMIAAAIAKVGDNLEKLSYAEVVTLTVMVWGVFGLFRVGELVVSGKAKFARVLRWRHVRLSKDEGFNVLIVYLDGSKTDPFRRGVEVRLCQQDDSLVCPLAWKERLLRAMRKRGLAPTPGAAVFRWADGKSVNRGSFVERGKALANLAGLGAAGFNGISLRKGGASSLALAGAGDLAIMRAGRWRSWCFARYVEESTASLYYQQAAMGGL